MFTIAMADNLLCDIQNQSAGNAYDSTPSFLERSRSLLSHAASAFAGRFNPVTRVKETINFFAGTARFVSTVTVGRWYLPQVEYQRRINDYWDTFNALSLENLAQLSMEQWVEVGASIAGDMVLGMGITKTARYLKEIQAVAKAQKKAAEIAKKLKRAVTNGLKENPYVVTADGLVLRASVEKDKIIGGAKEVLSGANELLKSFHEGHMRDLAVQIRLLEEKYNLTRTGLGEFSNKFIKLDYKHIFGFDLNFSRKGLAEIGGLHHDIANLVEKSGILEFAEKIMHPSGFYKADLWHNGHFLKNVTLFPANWTQEQVADCILKAYDNVKKSGITLTPKPDGKYMI